MNKLLTHLGNLVGISIGTLLLNHAQAASVPRVENFRAENVSVQFREINYAHFYDGFHMDAKGKLQDQSYLYSKGAGVIELDNGRAIAVKSIFLSIVGNGKSLSPQACFVALRDFAKSPGADTLELSSFKGNVQYYPQTKQAHIAINLSTSTQKLLCERKAEERPEDRLPDLVIRDIVWDPATPFYLTVEYENIGGTKDVGDFLIKISSNGRSFPGNSYYRFKIPAANVRTRTGGFTIGLIGLREGDIADVTAEIDWERRVEELNENNNTLTKRVMLRK